MKTARRDHRTLRPWPLAEPFTRRTLRARALPEEARTRSIPTRQTIFLRDSTCRKTTWAIRLHRPGRLLVPRVGILRPRGHRRQECRQGTCHPIMCVLMSETIRWSRIDDAGSGCQLLAMVANASRWCNKYLGEMRTANCILRNGCLGNDCLGLLQAYFQDGGILSWQHPGFMSGFRWIGE